MELLLISFIRNKKIECLFCVNKWTTEQLCQKVEGCNTRRLEPLGLNENEVLKTRNQYSFETIKLAQL